MGVYKCPVCEGRGFVSRDFYISQHSYGTSNSTATETCRTCGGKGIVFDAELFSNSCYKGPHQGDYGYIPMTFVSKGTCSNCEHNDRTVYTSNPVKYKCTRNNEYHEAGYRCEHWAEQQQVYLQGKPVIEDWLGTGTVLTATGTEDSRIEQPNTTNTTD